MSTSSEMGVVEGFEEAAGSDLCLESASLPAVGTQTDEAGDRKEPFQSPGERCWWGAWRGSRGEGWGGERWWGDRPADRWPRFCFPMSFFIRLEGEGGQHCVSLLTLTLHPSTRPRRLCWGL